MTNQNITELHHLQKSDIHSLCNLYRYPVSINQALLLYEKLQKEGAFGVYVEKRLVGIIEFFYLCEAEYEIGYRTSFQAQGKGYMKQGIEQCIRLCKEIGVKKLYARVLETNLASIHVLENNGFLQKINKDGVLLYVYDC